VSARSRLLVGLALLGAGAAAGMWLLLVSPALSVQRVTVSGTRTLDPVAIARAAEIRLGAPLARLDMAAAAARVAAHDRVASVAVRRSWPTTVAITIVERVPIAATRTAEGWRLVDAEGHLFSGPEDRSALPILTAAGTAERQAAAATLAALPGALLGEVTRIDAASPEDVQLVLADGTRVAWGAAELHERKASVLAVLRRVPGRVYDVSAPEVPAVRR